MADFFQNGIITTLHDFSTDNLEKMEARLGEPNKRRPIALILPIIPQDLNSDSFTRIVEELSKVNYISEVVLSLGQTDKFSDFVEARKKLSSLRTLYTVVWSSGPGIRSLFDELAENYLEVGPDGKGRGVWTALGYVLSNRDYTIIATHDCDIQNYSRRMLARLCYPCAIRGMDFEFTKAYYMRASDKLYGRVTRLFFTPLIRALQHILGYQEFLEFLHSFRYPLSGEICMSRSLAHVLCMPGDWGLEIGTLSEVYRTCSLTRVAQVDIAERYEHKHQVLSSENPQAGLMKMSCDIAQVLLQTLAAKGHVFPGHFFETLQATYIQMARQAIDQYAADAIINGLPYDRHDEGHAMESFSEAVRRGGQHFREDSTDMPRIPPWNRVMSALPDFPDRLAAVVKKENEQADAALREKRPQPVPADSPSTKN
ncbi:MAG: glycosyl transferase [Planctomycetes bacterium]|nr:glycosyl transferase [Planctomycetota bacterium]